MGSGKTTVGEFLHSRLKRTAMISTGAIKSFISDFERGEKDNGINAAVLIRMCEEYIKQGINILLPQAFWKQEYVESYAKLARENGVEFFVYQIEGPKELLLQRIEERHRQKSPTTAFFPEKALENLKKWELNRYALGKNFDMSTMSSKQISQLIIDDLKSKLGEIVITQDGSI